MQFSCHPCSARIAVFVALLGGCTAPAAAVDDAPPGFTRYEGRHLVLLTDLPPSKELEQLPAIFDSAVPQWAAFCRLAPAKADKWRVTACLMRNRERFEDAGLLPDDLPEFAHAFARADRVWLDEPTSEYYRRHQLLHEGTHAFMFSHLGAAGPPWFAEGTAELLATHRWHDGKLELDIFPAQREEVAKWGRIDLVQRDVAAGRVLSLDDVLAYDATAHQSVEAYAWSWAAAAFLSRHPTAGKVFERLVTIVERDDFNAELRKRLGGNGSTLTDEWTVFASELVYGYDFERSALDLRSGEDEVAAGKPKTVTVVADRGWQNTGIRVQAGQRYELRASGRFTIAKTDRPWPAEAGGISIRYHAGRPLGQLLAVVHPDPPSEGKAAAQAWYAPVAIGLRGEIASPTGGTLLLRLNDSPAELAENAGHVEATVEVR